MYKEEGVPSAMDGLINVIGATIEYEKHRENAKLTLVQLRTFDPYSCFKTIDANESGYVTELELSAFLQKNGVAVNKQDVYEFLHHIDTNSSGKLNYYDFLEVIIPKVEKELRNRACLKSCYIKRYPEFPKDCSYSLAKCIDTQIKGLQIVQGALSEVANRSTLVSLFSAVDDDLKGYWVEKDVMTLLANHELTVSKDDCTLFMMSLDKNRDGRITLNEFLDFGLRSRQGAGLSRVSVSASSPVKGGDVTMATPVKRSTYLLTSTASTKKSPGEQNESFSPERSRLAMSALKPSKLFSDIKESPEKPEKQEKQPLVTVPRGFVSFLQALIDNHRLVDKIRSELAARPDFTPDAFANLFGNCSDVTIKRPDFKKGLQKAGVPIVSEEEFNVLYRSLDPDYRGNILTERVKKIVQECGARRKYTPLTAKHFLTDETKWLITKFLRVLMMTENEIDSLKRGIHGNMRPTEIFEEIDTDNDGVIQAEEIEDYLMKNGKTFLHLDDIRTLMRALDRREKGKITLSDFVASITPYEAGSI